MPETETIIERLAARRRALGLTQREIADRVGLTRVALNRYENGHVSASEKILARIAEALGCTIEVTPKE